MRVVTNSKAGQLPKGDQAFTEIYFQYLWQNDITKAIDWRTILEDPLFSDIHQGKVQCLNYTIK